MTIFLYIYYLRYGGVNNLLVFSINFKNSYSVCGKISYNLNSILSNIMMCLPLIFYGIFWILFDDHRVIRNLNNRTIWNISLHDSSSTYQTFLSNFDFIKNCGIRTYITLFTNGNRTTNCGSYCYKYMI